MEPVLVDEERDIACFLLSSRTVKKLQAEPAKLAKSLPQTRARAVFIGFGDSACLRSNEFTLDPQHASGGFAVVEALAIR